MIRIDDVHAVKLLMRACQVQFVPKLHHAIAEYDRDDRIMGGTLYTEYTGGSCQVHFAGFQKGWITRSMLWLGFDYPFRQLGVNKIIGPIPEWNTASRDVALRMGFVIEYLMHDVYNRPDGVNGVYLVTMYREQCRWLNMRMPFIEFAPERRTAEVVKSMALAAMPAMGGVQ